MKPYIYYICLTLVMMACKGENDIESLKNKLKDKEKSLIEIQAEITKIKSEIGKKDPSFLKSDEREVLVTAIKAKKEVFSHYLENKGTVESEKDVVLSPKSMGRVNRVYVTEGQRVGAGSIILTQDNNVLQSNISALRTQLTLATTVYEKQKRLWDQNIGTEIQLLQAKNNRDAIQKNIASIQSQANLSTLTSPFSGIVEEVYIKQGAMGSPGMPAVRILNTSTLKINSSIPELYVGKVNVGDSVLVNFPSLKKDKKLRVSTVGQSINPKNRTFNIEVDVYNPDGKIKPQMMATLKFKDKSIEDAIIIPNNLVQKDVSGKFVFIIEKNHVKKIKVKTGDSYKNKVVIKEGLKGGEILVDEGFRFVADGNKVKVKESILK